MNEGPAGKTEWVLGAKRVRRPRGRGGEGKVSERRGKEGRRGQEGAAYE